MVVRAVNHVCFTVSDLDRSVEFYSKVLGCSVQWRRPELGLVHLRAGNAMIDLVPVDGQLGRREDLVDRVDVRPRPRARGSAAWRGGKPAGGTPPARRSDGSSPGPT